MTQRTERTDRIIAFSKLFLSLNLKEQETAIAILQILGFAQFGSCSPGMAQDELQEIIPLLAAQDCNI